MNHFLQLREQEAEVLRELNPRESLNSSISQSCLISVELSETFLSTWGFDSPLVDMPSVFYFIFFLSFFLFFLQNQEHRTVGIPLVVPTIMLLL